MKKPIKRNELAIFEEFRLKMPSSLKNKPPPKEELEKIEHIFYYYNEKFKKNTHWIETKSGRVDQVNEYGDIVFSGDDEYQKNIPKKSLLKKYKTDVRVHLDKHIEDYITWWAKDKNGELVQVNIKKEDVSIEFKIKSWLRNKAIDNVGLEIRSMKKKAYEYSKEKLEEMLKEEEKKIIKKKGWFGIKAAAVLMGFGYIPFI